VQNLNRQTRAALIYFRSSSIVLRKRSASGALGRSSR